MKKIGALLYLALIVSGYPVTYPCGNTPSRQPRLNFSGTHDKSRGTSLEPIRITLHYHEVDMESEEATEYFKSVIMKSAVEFLSKILLVYPLVDNLTLNGLSSCGDEVPVPESHQNEGVPDTDLLIYVTTENNIDVSYVAYAGACYLQEDGRNNVLAGRIVVNSPYYLSSTEEMKLSLITHELTHILGFSDGLFPYYHKSDGSPYATDEVYLSEEIRGTSRNIVILPTVAQEARKAFACDSLIGLELENQGGDGSAGSHWEMRIAYHDYMGASATPDTIYSTFTFALLKDTGWYDINWDYVQEPVFGAGKGCEFLTNSCLNEGVPAFSEFCTGTKESCDMFHLHKGYCDLVLHEDEVPLEYQYYPDLHLGGKGKYRDYCPIVDEYADGSCRGLGIVETWVNDLYGEIICPNCRCFEASLIQSGAGEANDFLHTACYEVFECYDTYAEVRIGNDIAGYEIVQCSFEGGQVEVPGYNGYLRCPSSSILCGNIPCINNCYGKGKCQNGICLCDDGYGGIDCSIKCAEGCSDCIGPEEDECLDCSAEGESLNDDGYCECNVGFEIIDGVCTCVDGYVDEENGLCYHTCDSLCVDCDIVTGNCLACDLHADIVDNKCECDDGFSFINQQCTPDLNSIGFLTILK